MRIKLVCSFLQVAYEDWFITLYNLAYSSLPVLLVGLLDQVTPCSQREEAVLFQSFLLIVTRE